MNKDKNDFSDKAWKINSKLIKKFVSSISDYQVICDEVVYILNSELNRFRVEFDVISSRVKKLDSFLEKIQRKKYSDPMEQIEDIIGVRVVYLYPNDHRLISRIIYDNFEVVDYCNTKIKLGINEFGYLGEHYIIRLSSRASGIRCRDLRKYKCELQIRTLPQNAWAILSHHLVYKNEDFVSDQIQRKLSALAGQFEIIDSYIDDMNKQFLNDLKEKIIKKINADPKKILHSKIDFDLLSEYLQWKFPDRPLEKYPGQLRITFDAISYSIYSSFKDLDYGINSTAKNRIKIFKELEKLKKNDFLVDGKTIPSCTELALALVLQNSFVFSKLYFDSDWTKIIKNNYPDIRFA